ncbi:MAG: hypothetical protein J6L81_06880 [Clostridia bacterium]|nr:hypothetical protein [Clostridia bacterium]
MQYNLLYAADKDGNIIHISNAQRGAMCECFCPSCGDALIARQGSEVKYHFAHSNNKNCTNGYLASVCCAIKQKIDQLGYICLPAYTMNRTIIDEGSGLHVIIPESKIVIDKVDLIKKSGNITGIMVYYKSKPLIINILTTYSTSRSRADARTRQIGIPVVEIDLSREEDIDDKLISMLINGQSDLIYWVYNQKAEGIWEKMSAKCSKLTVAGNDNAIYTMGCPIPKMRTDGIYCYIKTKCARCAYFFGLYGFDEERYILCSRQSVITEPADLKLNLIERKKKYGIK